MDAGISSMLAFDPDSPREAEGFVRNFSVQWVSDATSDPAEIAEELAAAVEDSGGRSAPGVVERPNGPVVRITETFPMGEVAVIHYLWTVTLYEHTADLALRQYGIPDGEGRFVLTFVSMAEEAPQYEAIWDAVVESFQMER